MIVTKCGNTACATGANETTPGNAYLPGPGSSYTMSLTAQPPAGRNVNVALITDGQTNIIPGGSITLEAIGALSSVPCSPAM